MGTVLIICRSFNIRKFYVDNLTARGYSTVGIMGLNEGGPELFERFAPGQFMPALVLMWGEVTTLETDIERIRQLYVRSLPIIVVSPEKPDKAWMVKWDIAAHRSGLSDSRQLMGFLHHWLV